MMIRPGRMGSPIGLPATRHHKLPLLAVLHFVAAAFAFAAPSGSSHQMLQLDPLETADIAMLEVLGEWIAEDPEDVRGVIRHRPTSFEVFRSYHEPKLRNSVLEHLPYGDLIARSAERHGLDPLLVAAVVETESHFNTLAISPRGAIGLMQVLPSTAAEDRETLFEPSINLNYGARYLRHLLRLFEGDLELALAAYNAGPTTVRRHGGVPPFRETRRYVEKVLARYFAHHQGVWQTSATGVLLAAAHNEAPVITDRSAG